MITGDFGLRYDLFVSSSQSLLWADAAQNRWNHSLALRSPSLASPPKAHFFEETTGPPAQCGRDCLAIRRTASAGTDIIRPLFHTLPSSEGLHRIFFDFYAQFSELNIEKWKDLQYTQYLSLIHI